MMEISLLSGDVKINIQAADDICKMIFKVFEGFADFGNMCDDADVTIKINDSMQNVASGALPFKDWGIYSSFVRTKEDKVEVWLNPQEDRTNNLNLVQMLVCNVYAKTFENKGYFFLHSSCVEKNGKAVVFCGQKNTGKTVNMLNLLSNGYNFVTNDMLMIKNDGNKLICRGMPYYIGIRLSEAWLSQNPQYLDYINKRGFQINKQDPNADENKLFISPRRVTQLNGAKISQEAEVRLFVNSYYKPYIKTLQLEELPKEKMANLLNSQNISALHPSKKFLSVLQAQQINDKTETFKRLLDVVAFTVGENEKSLKKIASLCDYVLSEDAKVELNDDDENNFNN